MPNEERGRLDSAIDRAVRGMMQVDPPPGLRHRVADRIETSRRRTWVVPAFATALAAAVVLILAVVLLRTPQVAPAPEPQLVSAPPAAPSEPPPQLSATTPRPDPEPVASAAPPPQQTQTTRPSGESIFGEKTGRVSAANVRPGTQAKPQPAEPTTQKAEPAGQPVNIKLDLTFMDQTGSSEPVRKVVSMIVADRGAGSIRSGGNVRNQGRVQISVDARPQVLQSGAIRLTLSLEYNPRAASNDGHTESSTLNEQITTIVEPGKPVVISQAADPASDRRITVEVRAALMK